MVTAPSWAWLLMLSEPMNGKDFTGSPYVLPNVIDRLTTPTHAVVKIVGGKVVELHQILQM
ncbi:hypothetical protein [Yimella sp. NH-Cas1]|uniref:hypothetical protein n=1 Tax=Yimella sp. NH-Cas1 TaxID=2917726 RepID=UPI001EFB6AA9|nr:hypothetical protein [Yimella sp. NH-Cas1]MCG8656485.1 hypothetical protein [Yimella sp. NH-Cas1]